MGFRHSGIFGRTQVGKSFLCKILCAGFTKAGRQTLVYDLTLDDQSVKEANEGSKEHWDAEYVTNDEETFLALFWGGFDLVCFVDEGNESGGRGNSAMRFATTRGSHQKGKLGAGNSIFYAAHKYTGLDATLRDQLSDFYVFATSKRSARDLGDDFDEPRLLGATKLPIGEFYHVGTGYAFTHHRIDFKKKEIIDLPTPEEVSHG